MANGGIRLKIQVKDAEGNVVNEFCKDNDLFTRNWGAWLAAILKIGFTPTAGTTYMAIDETGTARYLGSYSSSAYWNAHRATPHAADWGNSFRVAIGSSNAAPTVDDIALGAEIT